MQNWLVSPGSRASVCTYRQSLTYAWDHFDFLTDPDRRSIFRDNALGLFRRPG